MRKFDYLTYGRDVEFSTNIFTQTLPVLISLVIGSTPILVLPLSKSGQLLLFSLLSVLLFGILFLTVRWISKRTYSVELRNSRSQVLSVFSYSILGGAVILAGYCAFIVPHPHPDFWITDALLGVVYSLLYAELAAVGLVATIKTEGRSGLVSEKIEEFVELSQRIEQGTKNVDEDTPQKLVRLARSIADSINEEPASGTKELADRLNKWATKFEEEDDYIGRENMIASEEFSDLTDDLCAVS